MIDKSRIKAVAWAEIDLDAFKRNLKSIRNVLNNGEKICGIVKADAYGHGSVEIAKTLEENDVEYLAVSRAEEAMELRRKGLDLPILILGYTPEQIDTGMNRLGFKVTEESVQQIKEISEMDRISIKGIFTHFAAADEVDKSFTEMQGEKFKYMLNRLKEEGIEVSLVHAANSAAIEDCDDLKFDMVRAGIIMYGCY